MMGHGVYIAFWNDFFKKWVGAGLARRSRRKALPSFYAEWACGAQCEQAYSAEGGGLFDRQGVCIFYLKMGLFGQYGIEGLFLLDN